MLLRPEDVSPAGQKSASLVSVKEAQLVVEGHRQGEVVGRRTIDPGILDAHRKETQVGQLAGPDVSRETVLSTLLRRNIGGHRAQSPAELDWIGHPEMERLA